MIRLYNSLTKKLEEFTPAKKTVGLYTCGPTVYHYTHIGNLRTNIFKDVLYRTLSYFGYSVKQVMNVTDVGHLASDADTGEDKLAAAAARERKSAWEIAKFYTAAFEKDLKDLNILPPDKMPRATAHIKEQIALARELEKKGYVYKTADGIYFDTSKFPGYGKLSGQKLEDKEAGKRVAVGDKRHPADFALWKFSYPNGTEKPKDWQGPVREMEWPSPWGLGFPGWHLECSAMSRKYLGQPFDIHAGGIDLLPVHHENEIAQSEAAYGKSLARFWMHGEFLNLQEEKMSKSKGNILTLDELARRGFEPLAFRYFTFSAHYRTPLSFSFEALAAAQNALKNLRAAARTWPKPARQKAGSELEEKFARAIADDLDLPKAVAVLWEVVKSDLPGAEKSRLALKFDRVLGLDLKKFVAKPLRVPAAVKKLLAARAAARVAKNWSESDRLREKISQLGFSVEDAKEGQTVEEK